MSSCTYRVAAKVAAEAEAERLKADNIVLETRVKQMMTKEAERLDQINRMHEEMMENAKRQQVGCCLAVNGTTMLARGSLSGGV